MLNEISFCQSTINEVSLRHNPTLLANRQQMSVYGINSFDLRDYKAEGSPYLDNAWFNGSIKLFDGKVLSDLPLKFNVSDQTLVVQIEGQYFTLPNSVFTQFNTTKLTDTGKVEIVNFVRVVDVENSSSNYYEVVESNSIATFALLHSVKLVKASYNVAIDVGNVNDKYIKNSEHVLIVDDEVVKLKGSNNKILSKLSNQEFVAYVKKENINLNKISEVKKMISNFKN